MNQFSSEITQEALSFGYTTDWKFVPNAEFWSDRTAAVRKRRSFNATASSKNKPSVLRNVVLALAVASK